MYQLSANLMQLESHHKGNEHAHAQPKPANVKWVILHTDAVLSQSTLSD